MTESHSLGDMPCTGSPDHGILERLFQCPVYLITNFLYGRMVSNDQRLAEVRFFPFSVGALSFVTCNEQSYSLPLGVNPHQL